MYRTLERQMTFQSVSWFWDLYQRRLLDMDPAFQRRSVWNQEYKDYFVDTILLAYPAPAIFLYRQISEDGISSFSLVDGKQRLSTLFEFAQNVFPVSETATISSLRGKYFKDLDADTKTRFWAYQFATEYLPSADEEIINTIFDRINRNVSKLTRQELRHARFGGEFISEAEALAEWIFQALPAGFPNLAAQSRKQMKDVELVASLLLLIEEGPKSYSQDDFDAAFASRDASWEQKEEVETSFRTVVDLLLNILRADLRGVLRGTRLRNQADFYSLFGALHDLRVDGISIDAGEAATRLAAFMQVVEDNGKRDQVAAASSYYEAARSASNDAGPRRVRIDIMRSVLTGDVSVSV